MVALGFVGGGRNVNTNRTQAGQVAAVLREAARPGDLVVYCPDQVGPAVHRLAPPGLDEVTYPAFRGPEFVDWVDYKKRVAAADPASFARDGARAGRDPHAVARVDARLPHAPGRVRDARDAVRRLASREHAVAPDEDLFEHPGLQRFAPRAGGG